MEWVKLSTIINGGEDSGLSLQNRTADLSAYGILRHYLPPPLDNLCTWDGLLPSITVSKEKCHGLINC